VAGAGLTHGDWLERVPQLLSECAEEWGLRIGEPYSQGAAGYADRAGEPMVLKLIYPHREAEHEADALRVWDGDGAVELLAYDAERWAMLIERCEPGTLLARADSDTALDVLIGLIPRLWKRVDDPFNAAPIGRDYVLGHSREAVLRRLDRLCSELGLDRERALGWTIGQTVAWMFESTQFQKHLETVRWLVEARR
jgi:streptomycin 6-kinase